MSTMTMTTEEAIAEMFTESTGAHMLDSGGAYGRSWERNQSGAEKAGSAVEYFKSRPEVAFHFWDDKFDYLTIDGFHWLTKNVDYDPELQARFEAYAAESEEPWLVDMETFMEAEECAREGRVVNTYNFDTLLNETFQWVEWRDEYGDTLLLLSYHGGCDVRGGYTKPRAFRVVDDYMGDFRFDLFCTNSDWQTALDGSDVQVCGLSGSSYGGAGEVEWYDHSLETETEVDMSTLVRHPDNPVVPACPRCGSAMAGEIPTY